MTGNNLQSIEKEIDKLLKTYDLAVKKSSMEEANAMLNAIECLLNKLPTNQLIITTSKEGELQ